MSKVYGRIIMDRIEQEHKHILTMQNIDGKWYMACIHHECEYRKEIEPSEAYKEEL